MKDLRTLLCDKETVDQHLSTVHSDKQRNRSLGENNRIEDVEYPKVMLEEKEPTLKEIKEVVTKARTGSAPGPNGLMYKVYKKCPKLLVRLWKLLKVVWRKGVIPSCWQITEGCFVPKEENSKELNQHNISVEC